MIYTIIKILITIKLYNKNFKYKRQQLSSLHVSGLHQQSTFLFLSCVLV